MNRKKHSALLKADAFFKAGMALREGAPDQAMDYLSGAVEQYGLLLGKQNPCTARAFIEYGRLQHRLRKGNPLGPINHGIAILRGLPDQRLALARGLVLLADVQWQQTQPPGLGEIIKIYEEAIDLLKAEFPPEGIHPLSERVYRRMKRCYRGLGQERQASSCREDAEYISDELDRRGGEELLALVDPNARRLMSQMIQFFIHSAPAPEQADEHGRPIEPTESDDLD